MYIYIYKFHVLLLSSPHIHMYIVYYMYIIICFYNFISSSSSPALGPACYENRSSSVESYSYGRVPSTVPFYAKDMPNTETWLKQENYILDLTAFNTGIMACHLCSYLCYVSQGSGDPDTRCYFPTDKDVPASSTDYLCRVSLH